MEKKERGDSRFQVQCPCPVTQKGLFSKLPGRKINFSFPNVFETQSEDWLIENPDPFDQAAPGSSCQTICVISSDFCLRVKWLWREKPGGWVKTENTTSSWIKLNLIILIQISVVTVDCWWRGRLRCVIIYCVWFLAVPSLLLYCDVCPLARPVTVSLGAHAGQEPVWISRAPEISQEYSITASYWPLGHTELLIGIIRTVLVHTWWFMMHHQIFIGFCFFIWSMWDQYSKNELLQITTRIAFILI